MLVSVTTCVAIDHVAVLSSGARRARDAEADDGGGARRGRFQALRQQLRIAAADDGRQTRAPGDARFLGKADDGEITHSP